MLDLLGKSQTFYGVLATILVLCIFKNANNFINEILTDIENYISKKISSLGVKTNCDAIGDKIGARMEQETDGEKKALLGQQLVCASKLQREISLRNKVLPNKNYKAKIERIKQADEIVSAPLFTLFYCFAVFIVDGVLRSSFASLHQLSFTMLSIFTLYSSAYWMMLWGNFVHRSICRRERTCSDTMFLSSKHHVFSLLLFCVLPFMGTMLFVQTMEKDSMLVSQMMLWLSLLLPFVITGGYFIYKKPKSANGYYISMLLHFLLMVVLSMLVAWTWLYFGANIPCLSEKLIVDSTGELLKLGIFLFTTINGLLLPFFLPLICSGVIYQFQAKKRVTQEEKRIAREIEKIQGKLDEIG